MTHRWLLAALVVVWLAPAASANTAQDALVAPYVSAQLFQPPKTVGGVLFDGTGTSTASAHWNDPIPAGAALTSNSAAQAALMASEMGIEPANTQYGNRWGIAYNVYVADAATPLKTACSRYVLNGTSWSWNRSFHEATVTDRVPVPTGALVYDGGQDHSMAIYQPSTNTYWDFFVGLDPAPAGTVDPQGRSCDFLYYGGGRIKSIGTVRQGYPWPQWPAPWYSASPGYFRAHLPTEDRSWGRMASALPVIAGLITPQEWNAAAHGTPIPHALSFDVRWAGCGRAWPAYRNDCNPDGLPRIVEGSRIRIDPSVQCLGHGGDLGHERSYQLCRAMQDYGAYVKDQTGGGYAIGWRNGPVERDSTFGATYSSASFYYDWNRAAWSHVQVLAEPAHTEWKPGCYC